MLQSIRSCKSLSGTSCVCISRKLDRFHSFSCRWSSQQQNRTKPKEQASPSITASESNSSNTSNQYAMAGAALFITGAVASRLWYGNLIAGHNSTAKIRRDQSRVRVVLPCSQGSSSAPLPRPISLNADEFEKFLNEQRDLVRKAARKHAVEANEQLANELQQALEPADARVAEFCDWYLSYATTYKLLGIASTAAAKYAVMTDASSTLNEYVTGQLALYVEQKYQAIVLRPAQTDPRLHRAFVASVQYAHALFQDTLSELDQAIVEHVEHQKDSGGDRGLEDDDRSSPYEVIWELDWTTQRQKVQHMPAVFSKSPERTVALVTAGAATGKAVSAAAAKGLISKLVGPFLVKTGTAGASSKAAAALAAGAIGVTGPVGAAAGVALGVGVDVGVNAVSGLFQRTSLEQDVRTSLQATLDEWREGVLEVELERVQKEWYGQLESTLLPPSEKTES